MSSSTRADAPLNLSRLSPDRATILKGKLKPPCPSSPTALNDTLLHPDLAQRLRATLGAHWPDQILARELEPPPPPSAATKL